MLVEVGLSCRCVCSLFCSTAAGGLITSGSVGVQGWVLGTSEGVAQMFPAIWPDPAWQNRYLQMFFIELENSVRQRNSEQHLPGLSRLELGTWGSLSSHPASCLLQWRACQAWHCSGLEGWCLQKAVWWSQTSHSALGTTSTECVIGIQVCTCYGNGANIHFNSAFAYHWLNMLPINCWKKVMHWNFQSCCKMALSLLTVNTAFLQTLTPGWVLRDIKGARNRTGWNIS